MRSMGRCVQTFETGMLAHVCIYVQFANAQAQPSACTHTLNSFRIDFTLGFLLNGHIFPPSADRRSQSPQWSPAQLGGGIRASVHTREDAIRPKHYVYWSQVYLHMYSASELNSSEFWIIKSRLYSQISLFIGYRYNIIHISNRSGLFL